MIMLQTTVMHFLAIQTHVRYEVIQNVLPSFSKMWKRILNSISALHGKNHTRKLLISNAICTTIFPLEFMKTKNDE